MTGTERKPRWQVGMRTLFLLVAACAVWFAYYVNRQDNAALSARIASTRPLARELDIADPGKMAVVKRRELWMDDNDWDVYLPEGKYRLCLATREIGQQGESPVSKSAPLSAGRHRIGLKLALEADTWKTAISSDGERLLEATEPKEWNPNRGSTGGGAFSISGQVPVDKPAELFRQRFVHPDAKGSWQDSPEVTEGILMWIERVK